MSHQVAWNKIILEEFVRIGGLTAIEERVIRTRVAGWSRVEQSMKLGLSLASIDRITQRLKVKYDNVQIYSPLLPPRRFSAKDTYKKHK